MFLQAPVALIENGLREIAPAPDWTGARIGCFGAHHRLDVEFEIASGPDPAADGRRAEVQVAALGRIGETWPGRSEQPVQKIEQGKGLQRRGGGCRRRIARGVEL